LTTFCFQKDAPSCDVSQAGDEIEQRRLPAAGMADDRDVLALVDRQGDVAQNFRGAAPRVKDF
jgi:hypothetical protein